MSQRFDMSNDADRAAGLSAAVETIRSGQAVVIPTDTVYGVAVDAFSPESVAHLFEVKIRGRDMPPPVLVGGLNLLSTLADNPPSWAEHLATTYWPGALTLVCTARDSLNWDLGDTHGTVAIRMPDNDVALELLTRTGPLAVSSANISGMPAATSAVDAQEMLGSRVSVFLDGGPTAGQTPSTIVDCTREEAHILREGAISVAQIKASLAAVGVTLAEPNETDA